jgi:hypothetical protein
VIRSCMYPVDANEVLKIRLTNRGDEDCIAWHYEKFGIFTVRSAYKLALVWEQANRRQVGSSARADGSRKVYNEIWSAQVPLKVFIFAWKRALGELATQCNRKRRTLTDDATCCICGREEENGHHAIVCCTKATALWHELRHHLSLLEENHFVYTGPDWLLLLLSSVSPHVKANILMMLWRV